MKSAELVVQCVTEIQGLEAMKLKAQRLQTLLEEVDALSSEIAGCQIHIKVDVDPSVCVQNDKSGEKTNAEQG